MNLEKLGIPFSDLGENKELELFWHISQSLVSKNFLDEILQLIVTMTAGVMKTKICSLMLLDPAKNELKIAATQALSSSYINKANVKVGESVSGRAVKEKKPIVVLDVRKDKNYNFPQIAKEEGLVSMISVPMIVSDRIIGVINAYTKEAHVFSESEIKLLQAVANQAAVAIENTRLREENVAVKQALDERKTIDRAKSLLMEHQKLKESEAYHMIQKASRDQRKSMAEVAQAISLFYSLKGGTA